MSPGLLNLGMLNWFVLNIENSPPSYFLKKDLSTKLILYRGHKWGIHPHASDIVVNLYLSIY